ncbi:hypothetical protein ACTPOK_05945 [Streptomyces inhibens]|uniref:hypothetical protein n=1 Tax=Streptomyces inhibens TaxID=2293571 RepID=UPI00402AC952
MSAFRRHSERASVGDIGDGRWLTVPGCKQVLVVAHSVTYLQRLRAVFSLLEQDPRLQVVCTVPPHQFGEGVHEALAALGIPVIPWRRAVRREFDLALSAGSRGTERIRARLVRLSHGAGQIKVLRSAREGAASDGKATGRHEAGTDEGRTAQAQAALRPPAMLSREYLLHEGRVVPAAVALSHERDLAELARTCPEALPVARVVGDPCHDRIAASLRLRRRYRQALGLGERQKLVVVATTWGRSSAFGSFETLLPRLATELPADRFRTAVLVHPNVWAGHGSRQIRAWLTGFRRRGPVPIPPEADWRSILVAADWIIGDHGSVTSYGTLTSAPVLLARFPDHEVHPDSPAAALARTAPALTPARPLREQLRYAAAEYRRADYARIAAMLSSEPGRFNTHMRSLLYGILGLGRPAFAPVTAVLPSPPPLDSWAGLPGSEAA